MKRLKKTYIKSSEEVWNVHGKSVDAAKATIELYLQKYTNIFDTVYESYGRECEFDWSNNETIFSELGMYIANIVDFDDYGANTVYIPKKYLSYGIDMLDESKFLGYPAIQIHFEINFIDDDIVDSIKQVSFNVCRAYKQYPVDGWNDCKKSDIQHIELIDSPTSYLDDIDFVLCEDAIEFYLEDDYKRIQRAVRRRMKQQN